MIIKNQQFDSKYGLVYYNITVNGRAIGWEDNQYPQQTAGSDSTKISLDIYGQCGLPSIVGQQVSIQVQALLGSLSYTGHNTFPFQSYYDFTGQTSDWSNTQTIGVPANSPLTSPSPTSTPTVPEFPTLIILPLFAVATLLSIVLIRKTSKTQSERN